MSQHFADDRPNTEPTTDGRAKALLLGNESTTQTALGMEMTDSQRIWLINFLDDRWSKLDREMGDWRSKMAMWERMSEGNYSDRAGDPDDQQSSPTDNVFRKLNESLGMTEGFADFFTAQARNDLFGTKPWLAATPEGRADAKLADLMTKHASWKIDQSNLEACLRDGTRIAAWGGTAFVKSRWIREEETFKRPVMAAFSKSTDAAYRTEDGELVRSVDEFPKDEEGNPAVDGEDVEWRRMNIEDTQIVADNSCSSCIDYKDIAFDRKAPELALIHTDVFVKFRMGMLDVIRNYNIPADRLPELRTSVLGRDETAREERGESSNTDKTTMFDPDNANPEVTLIEGFVRIDLFENGKPIRIHVIFSPDMRILFSAEYLAGVTPGGLLPVFPLRINKIPNRIFGIGYFEKFLTLNNAVDRKHCAVTLRSAKASQVITSIQPEALKEPEQDEIEIDSDKPIQLASGKKLADFIEFSAAPDMNGRELELRNQELQMAQMRSGITSAAQGEMAGVPSASTATGTNQIISRGAILLKDPIDSLSADIRVVAEFNVHLLYANQDRDETFTWGEGQDAALLEIKAGDVQGLRANVKLTMIQSQNQEKLKAAQSAIGVVSSYIALPEPEKTALRPLFIQSLMALGFRNAEDIIRPAAVDPAGILALMPPDVAPIIQQALTDAGVMAPQAPEGAPSGEASAAPVVDAPVA